MVLIKKWEDSSGKIRTTLITSLKKLINNIGMKNGSEQVFSLLRSIIFYIDET